MSSTISAKWSIMTAIDTFNIEKSSNIIPLGNSDSLRDIEIVNQGKNFNDQIKDINYFLENNDTSEKKINFEKYFKKFESRYSGKLNLTELINQIIKLKLISMDLCR